MPSIVSTWIMVRKLNSRKVNNCCIHMKYSANGRQPENNFLWDKSTILSTVSIWEINYGRSNITVHLMSTKDLVLNLLNSGKHSGSFDEFSNETAEKLPISSLLPTWILLKKNWCGQPKVIMPYTSIATLWTFGSIRVNWYGWHTGLTILQSRVYYHPRNNIKWYGWHTGLTIL